VSGGSFDYLCFKAPGEAYDHNTVRAMAQRLRELGYGAAADEVIAVYLAAPSPGLKELMTAVEWMDSGDWGIERVREIAAEHGYPVVHDPVRDRIRSNILRFSDVLRKLAE
jgi:hypothetical protein